MFELIIWLVCGFIGACMVYGVLSQTDPVGHTYQQVYHMSNITVVLVILGGIVGLLTGVFAQIIWCLLMGFKFKLKLPFTELTEMKEKYFNE